MRKSRSRRLLSWLVAAGCALAPVAVPSLARAELPAPRFDRLVPLGANAGAKVTVEVIGADFEEAKSLWFDHPGLTAAAIEGKERQFEVTVAADVPAGTYDVWVVGRFGVSNPRLLHVSRGLTDVAEVEPNNGGDKTQPIAINSAVNGSSDQNDQDVFRFTARKGQRLTIQVLAGRLDSMLDANLTLQNAAGATLAANGDYFGRDPFLDFTAPQDGEYLVAVNDLSFRGGHPYRLIVSDRPQLENAFPRAVQAGQTTELTFLGRNLTGGAASSRWRLGEQPLDELRRPISPSADILTLGTYRFAEHPTAHTTLPTAATCTLVGLTAGSGLDGALGDAVPLVVVDAPVTLEAEPNSTREQPQVLTLPAVVSGRFDEPRDADWYEITPTENASYAFEVYCERIGGRADPYVAVFDEQNNRVTELDDYGHRVNAFDGHLRDPSGSVGLTANKKYKLLVQDRYSRGGSRYQYVLKVTKPQPDFFVAAIHSQNPGPGGLTVRRGGSASLDLVIHQTGGWTGPITISAENPPAGLQVAPTAVYGNSAPLVVSCSADAPESIGLLKLVAEGKRGDQTIRREVRPYSRVWNDPGMNSSRPLRQLPVAIRGGAPFDLSFETPQVQIVAGKKAEVKLKLARLLPEFQNSVNVLPQNVPGNLKVANVSIAAGASEVVVPIEVQSNTKPGVYTLSLVGQAQVPFSKDAQMKNPPNTLVTLPTRPLQVEVTAAAP